MSALTAAWDSLLTAARKDPPSPGEVDHATMAMIHLAAQAPSEALVAIQAAAGEIVRTAPLATAAPVAMTCGALIEHGAPGGDELARGLLERLPEVLAAAAGFAAAVEALGAEPTGGGLDGTWVGDCLAPGDWIRDRYQSHRDEVVAWHELHRFSLPLIAAATRDRVVLHRLGRARLGTDLEVLRHLEPHARFLWLLHHVLLDAPVRFFDLVSGRVFDLRIDAVATNFELHTLLHAALAEPLELEPPDPEVVACLRGQGPRQLLTKSHSAWALYSHEALPALAAGGRVPMEQWVWNESIPALIPEIEGVRVLVAGEQSYAREWDTGRTFTALGGTVEVVAELASRAPAQPRVFDEE